jgi:hypothetical protein
MANQSLHLTPPYRWHQAVISHVPWSGRFLNRV